MPEIGAAASTCALVPGTKGESVGGSLLTWPVTGCFFVLRLGGMIDIEAW